LRGKPAWRAWSGWAFESVCLVPVDAIQRAIGISGMETSESAWMLRGHEEGEGAQIDLLIDRADDAISVCELKLTEQPFTVTKSTAQSLGCKIAVLCAATHRPGPAQSNGSFDNYPDTGGCRGTDRRSSPATFHTSPAKNEGPNRNVYGSADSGEASQAGRGEIQRYVPDKPLEEARERVPVIDVSTELVVVPGPQEQPGALRGIDTLERPLCFSISSPRTECSRRHCGAIFIPTCPGKALASSVRPTSPGR
jgi:hypothetical protein